MVVEDSQVVRDLLEHLINRDPRLEVVASARSAEQALRLVRSTSPDVISMDIRLPGMNGFEATRRIMAETPTPIVVVSGSVDADDLKISMNAMRVGALSVVEKPCGGTNRDYEQLSHRLCTQLAIMSQVKVIRQRMGIGARLASQVSTSHDQRPTPSAVASGRFEMVGIVASTGGPNALQKVLGTIDNRFPLPILIVQHMTSGFLEGFASWLNSVSCLPVLLANDGQTPLPGRVYLAPAECHLRVEQGKLRLAGGPPVNSERPSGTMLFDSMAESLGPNALAVLLTGMGSDGAAGLRAIRDAGGYTIAEHESTAAVYGMPAVAVRMGAACEVLPLGGIVARLEQLVTSPEVP